MPEALIGTSPSLDRRWVGKSSFSASLEEVYKPHIFRAAWLVLLARYSRADMIEVKDIGESGSFEINTESSTDLGNFLDQVYKSTVGDACFTYGATNTFPLAESRLDLKHTKFATAFFHNVVHDADLSSCHIIIEVTDSSVTVSVDESLSSQKHDAGLPKRLAGQLKAVAVQLQNAKFESTIGAIEFMGSSDWADADKSELPYPELKHDTLHNMMLRDSLPDSPAVEAWDGKLTYGELDRASSVLARKLRKVGVGRGSYVPLFFDKSLWHPVCMFACSKIGAIFFTIPFDMPSGRVKSILNHLKDSQGRTSRVALSSVRQDERAAAFVPTVIQVDANTVSDNVDGFDSISEGENQDDPTVKPKDVAYLVFTSGTTGIPKIIAIAHFNICSFIPAWIALRGHSGGLGVRHSQILSYAFDMSMVESLVSLCTGSCLCIPSENERVDDLGRALVRYGITHLHTTPSLSEILDPDDMPELKHVHFSGEWITHSLVNRWLPKIDVLLTYGTAEITNECSGARVSLEPGFSNGCIGRPFGARMYITNPDNPHQRMPRGFVGEIIVEGPGVSEGYVASPETTVKAFVQDLVWAPAIQHKPRRFYRTGDLGYQAADGLFVCRGRSDLQVKIRGHRIELAEVESTIKSFMPKVGPVVAETVVLRGGMKVLVAFLQLDTTLSMEWEDLIESLKEHLPEMLAPASIPSSFIMINRIPLGRTGKADRKKLKDMIGNISMSELLRIKTLPVASGQSSSLVSPSVGAKGTPDCNRVLHEILVSVLPCDVSEITPNANFFALGGDSLLAMKTVSLAKKKGITLSVRHILRNPTLAALTRIVASSERPTRRPKSQKVAQHAETLQDLWSTKSSPSPLGSDAETTTDTEAKRVEQCLRKYLPMGGDCAIITLVPRKMAAVLVAFVELGPRTTGVAFESEVAQMRRQLAKDLPRQLVPIAFYPMPQPAAHIPHSIREQLAGDAAAVEDVTLVSPYQQKTIKLMQRTRGFAAVRREFTILPAMDIDRLAKAWDLVSSRLPSMRTRVVLSRETQTPYLVTLLSGEKLEICHYSTATAAEAYLESFRLAVGSFDSTLIRAAVVHVAGSGPPIFACAMSHVVYDGYTVQVFWQALSDAYWSGNVPQTQLPYRRYMEHLASLDPAPARRFWKHYLDGAQPVEFPSKPTPGHVSHVARNIQAVEFPFPRRRGSPIMTTTLVRAALGLTIGSCTGSADVVSLELLSGRTIPVDGIENMPGPTINEVPIRVRADDGMMVVELLARIQEDGAEILDHESTGLAAISDLSPEIASVVGSFNCGLVVQPTNEDGTEGTDMTESTLPMQPASRYEDLTGQVALVLSCRIYAERIVIRALHDPEVLDDVAACGMLDRFRCFIETLAMAERDAGITVGVLRRSTKYK
ncbi:Nonribosomal peptide synthetase [Hyphodiscus hymeniophilus]|uniref:Nonribosomal peptide synthetase n=1 Tax=Hyphodiscus hymeniophilus TaxID=353542 RepID=A0A9P6VGQ5_9HELO|nr:Nonribosomal peptide synthetase [Hyphodiscus hymeniophilus]